MRKHLGKIVEKLIKLTIFNCSDDPYMAAYLDEKCPDLGDKALKVAMRVFVLLSSHE